MERSEYSFSDQARYQLDEWELDEETILDTVTKGEVYKEHGRWPGEGWTMRRWQHPDGRWFWAVVDDNGQINDLRPTRRKPE